MLHTCCNTPPCLMVARLIQGGVLYPAVPDYEFRCASTDTRISFECHSNAPPPTLECPKTEFECIRKRQIRNSNARKRNSNAFENAKTNIRISGNQYSDIYLDFVSSYSDLMLWYMNYMSDTHPAVFPCTPSRFRLVRHGIRLCQATVWMDRFTTPIACYQC